MPPLEITSDNIFKKSFQPDYEGLVNSVEIPTQPYIIQAADEIYSLKEPFTIGDGATVNIVCTYKDKPVLPYAYGGYTAPVVTVEEVDGDGDVTGKYGVVMGTTTYHGWGVNAYIYNGLGYESDFILSIQGCLLKIDGETSYQTTDAASIIEFREKTYKLKKNHLIQTMTMAKIIGDRLLAAYKDAYDDIEIDWRGNPALELGDEITTTTYDKNGIKTEDDFMVVKQRLQFDGTLRASLSGKVVV